MSEDTEILLTKMAGLPLLSPPTFTRYNLLQGTVEGKGALRLRTEEIDIQATLNHFEIGAGPTFHGTFDPFSFDLAEYTIIVPDGATLDDDGLWSERAFLEIPNGAVARLDNFRFAQDGFFFGGQPGGAVIAATARRLTASRSSDSIALDSIALDSIDVLTETKDEAVPWQKIFLPLISR